MREAGTWFDRHGRRDYTTQRRRRAAVEFRFSPDYFDIA